MRDETAKGNPQTAAGISHDLTGNNQKQLAGFSFQDKSSILLFSNNKSSFISISLDSAAKGPGFSPSRGTVLCSWARHLTLTVPLSTQVYK